MSTEVSLLLFIYLNETRFGFVILGVLFNLTKLISNENLCLQWLAKINPQYRYPNTEYFEGKKYPKISLIQARYRTKRLKIK